MMDFVTGVDIPPDYLEYLEDELALGGESSKDPRWDTPKLKAAAGRMKVIVVGAGMSGLLTGIRLEQAGIPFKIIEKNADVGGTWFENTYPGCRVDILEPHLLLLLRAQPRLAAALLAPSRCC